MTASQPKRTGVWMIGARGGLATTVIAGAALLRRGACPSTGMLTGIEPFSRLPLPAVESLCFGGHEIHGGSLIEAAEALDRENRTLPRERLDLIRDDLAEADARIRPGTALGAGPAILKLARGGGQRAPGHGMDLVERLSADMAAFQRENRLDDVVVVHVASTEPPLDPDPAFRAERRLTALLKERWSRSAARLRPSVLYGYAAATLGYPAINFTPNRGSLLPAIQVLARRNGAPVMGHDGKTGETLVKSALAPMFKYRNLKVLSWQGYNLLGDRDGEVLRHPENKRAKVASKDGLLRSILGYPLHTHVGIDFVPSLKDLKTAWDFIHFEGFLGFPMNLQFTWQGCDSILAAPLVLDLARLAAHAKKRGETGLLTYLSCFFKSPAGVSGHDLHFQFRHLLEYAEARLRGDPWKSGGISRE